MIERRLLPVPTILLAALAAAPVAAAAPPTPGPVIPGTEYPDAAVTVTDPGDPSSTVTLRSPLAVGATARTESVQWDRGSETYSDGSDSSSSNWDWVVERTGTDEVLDVRPDGSSLVRWTQDSIEQTLTYSNPEHAGDDPNLEILNGARKLVEFGPSRQSIAVYQDAAAPLTAEQVELSERERWQLTIPMPAEPVGVGATWTWTEPQAISTIPFGVAATATLRSVSGGRYDIRVSLALDPAVPLGEPAPDSNISRVESVQYSATMTVDGSTSNPLDYHEKTEATYSVVVQTADGLRYESNGALTSEYWERPSSAAPTTTAPTSVAPTTAVAPPTSVAPTTTAPTSVAPTTAAAPTSSPPTTAAPTTAATPTTSIAAPTTAVAGPTTSVVAPPTASPTAATTRLVDDTGRLTVAVPASWTATSTAPASTGQALLIASPDLSRFSPNRTIPTDYSVPGVYILETTPIPFDPAEAATFLPFDGCTEGPPAPYSDGTFTGSVITHSSCHGTTATVSVLAANRDDGSAGITVVVLLTQPDKATLDAILASLDGDPTS